MEKYFLMLVMIVGLALMGPECKEEEIPADDEAVLNAVRENVAAAQDEDLERYLATIDPESPYFETTKEVVPRRFEKFDLNFDLQDLKVVKKTETSALVQFTQTVTKVKGPEFQDVKVSGVYLMQKRGGHWKITDVDNQAFEPITKAAP